MESDLNIIKDLGNFNKRVLIHTPIELINSVEKTLKSVEYSFSRRKSQNRWLSHEIFTFIITVHDVNPNYYIECVQSILNQTYKKIEVIIVEHGTNREITDYNMRLLLKDDRVKILRILENKIDNFFGLINAAIFFSIGEYFYFIAHDDKVSNNFVEKMMELFLSKSNCNTAAPLPISINKDGDENTLTSEIFRTRNSRNQFTNGVNLVSSFINNENKICMPGGIFAHRTINVLKHGGIDAENDVSQIFKFAIYGESGFDSSAILYWRHHDLQTNRLLTKQGFLKYKLQINYFLDLSKVIKINVGSKIAEDILKYGQNYARNNLVGVIVRLIESKNFTVLALYCARMVKEVPIFIIIFSIFESILKILIKVFNKGVRHLKDLIKHVQ